MPIPCPSVCDVNFQVNYFSAPLLASSERGLYGDICVCIYVCRRAFFSNRYVCSFFWISQNLACQYARNYATGFPNVDVQLLHINPLITTLKPQSNGQSYSDTVTGTLAVDGWAVTSLQRGGDWVGPQPAQAPPCCAICKHPSTASVPTSCYSTWHYNWSLKG